MSLLLLVALAPCLTTAHVDLEAVKLHLHTCRQSSDNTASGADICTGAIVGKQTSSCGWPPESAASNTKKELRAFWETQVEWLTDFTAVTITLDKSHKYRLTSFDVTVDGRLCHRHAGQSFSVQTFNFPSCPEVEDAQKQPSCNCRGRVMRIQQVIHDHLSLVRVDVSGIQREPSLFSLSQKLRLRRCRQSSNFEDISFCTGAIDGDASQVWAPLSASTTNLEDRPWWEARTLAKSNITHVRIFNRLDDHYERLTNFVITVDRVPCAEYDGGFFPSWTFDCNLVGNTLSIASRVRTILTLMEVQAYGVPL